MMAVHPLLELRTVNDLDACQRVIESDSLLMQIYLRTPQAMTVRERISEVFKSQIRHNADQLAEFHRIRKELEAQDARS